MQSIYYNTDDDVIELDSWGRSKAALRRNKSRQDERLAQKTKTAQKRAFNRRVKQ